MDAAEKPILLFDGVCNLCNGVVRFIIRRDREGRIRFASQQSQAGRDLLGKLGLAPDAENPRFMVLAEGGRHSLRSTAVLRVLKMLGWPWKALFILIAVPRFLRDALYDLVAANRYRIWGRREECLLPTPELKGRFLG